MGTNSALARSIHYCMVLSKKGTSVPPRNGTGGGHGKSIVQHRWGEKPWRPRKRGFVNCLASCLRIRHSSSLHDRRNPSAPPLADVWISKEQWREAERIEGGEERM